MNRPKRTRLEKGLRDEFFEKAKNRQHFSELFPDTKKEEWYLPSPEFGDIDDIDNISNPEHYRDYCKVIQPYEQKRNEREFERLEEHSIFFEPRTMMDMFLSGDKKDDRRFFHLRRCILSFPMDWWKHNGDTDALVSFLLEMEKKLRSDKRDEALEELRK